MRTGNSTFVLKLTIPTFNESYTNFTRIFVLLDLEIKRKNNTKMAKPLELTDQNFEEIINTDKPVLVDFWAEWCGPCKMIAPVVEELAADYEGKAVIAKVDVDSNPEVSAKFGIRSIPTLLVFKGGEVVDKQVGAVPKTALSEKLDKQLT